MRNSLNAIVRRLLEAQATDEATNVDPAVLRTLSPERAKELGVDDFDLKHDGKQARSAHAFVNTDNWRERARRMFSFLDSHGSVKDVNIKPIAVDHRSHLEELENAPSVQVERTRLVLLDAEEGRDAISAAGADPRGVERDCITIVPIVGWENIAPPGPGNLPTPWMVAHSLFDSGESAWNLARCNKVRRDLTDLFGSDSFHKMSPGLLLNCGWSRGALKMLLAAEEMGGSAVLSKITAPPVGARIKNVAIDSEKAWRRPANNYVFRPVSDLVAESMTIAVINPEGVQPRLEDLERVPDSILRGDFQVYASGWSDPVPDPLPEEYKKWVRDQVRADLQEIKEVTADLRDLLAADLLGKVIFVSVH